MKKLRNISVAKFLTVTIMCFCLIFLSGANFILYPPSHNTFCTSSRHDNDSKDEELPIPIEENSSGKTCVSLQEDYLHEFQFLNCHPAFAASPKYISIAPEKLEVVHFELISPPPEV